MKIGKTYIRKVRAKVIMAIVTFAIVAVKMDLYAYFRDIVNLSASLSSHDVVRNTSTTNSKPGHVEYYTDWNKFLLSKNRQKDYQLNPLRSTLEFDKDVYDILNVRQVQFESKYKNPCWTATDTEGLITDGKFHCVPYFYLIGVKKSATTNLFQRLSKHPEIVSPGFKESQWMTRRRWGITKRKNQESILKMYKGVCSDVRSVKCYISLFDKAAKKISLNASFITGEGTPANFHIHTNWHLLPGNEGLPEPKYTNFHYLDHISPKAKIIIILRDPVTRLYSDFWHTTMYMSDKIKTPEEFHSQIVCLTKVYSECFSRWSVRRCIYNETMRNDLIRNRVYLAESFTAGFYAFYMKEMINVFGKIRIHTVLTQEYHDNMDDTLRKIFTFLDISQLSAQKSKQQIQKKKKYDAILNKSRDMLYSFYEPFNRQMADLMKDDRYLFQKPE